MQLPQLTQEEQGMVDLLHKLRGRTMMRDVQGLMDLVNETLVLTAARGLGIPNLSPSPVRHTADLALVFGYKASMLAFCHADRAGRDADGRLVPAGDWGMDVSFKPFLDDLFLDQPNPVARLRAEVRLTVFVGFNDAAQALKTAIAWAQGGQASPATWQHWQDVVRVSGTPEPGIVETLQTHLAKVYLEHGNWGDAYVLSKRKQEEPHAPEWVLFEATARMWYEMARGYERYDAFVALDDAVLIPNMEIWADQVRAIRSAERSMAKRSPEERQTEEYAKLELDLAKDLAKARTMLYKWAHLRGQHLIVSTANDDVLAVQVLEFAVEQCDNVASHHRALLATQLDQPEQHYNMIHIRVWLHLAQMAKLSEYYTTSPVTLNHAIDLFSGIIKDYTTLTHLFGPRTYARSSGGAQWEEPHIHFNDQPVPAYQISTLLMVMVAAHVFYHSDQLQQIRSQALLSARAYYAIINDDTEEERIDYEENGPLVAAFSAAADDAAIVAAGEMQIKFFSWSDADPRFRIVAGYWKKTRNWMDNRRRAREDQPQAAAAAA